MAQKTITLRDEKGFPLAIYRKGEIPNLADIAGKRHVSTKSHGAFGFGVDSKKTAIALRLLADQLEAGTAIPQGVTDATTAPIDDFAMRTLTFTFAVRHEPENISKVTRLAVVGGRNGEAKAIR